MAGPAFVTGQSAATSGAGSSVNVTINGVTAGNMLVVVATTDDATAPSGTSVSDNLNGTYTQIISKTNTSNGSLAIFVKLNVAAGNTQITFSNGTVAVAMSAAEYTPNGLSGNDGTAVNNAGVTGTPSAGTINTTNADDVLIAGVVDSSSNTTWTAGASYALRSVVTSSANTNVGYQDRTVSATSGYSTAFGNSALNGWTTAAMAIKAAAASAVTADMWMSLPQIPRQPLSIVSY